MCPDLQFPVGLGTFTEEILNEKFHFLWNEYYKMVEIGWCKQQAAPDADPKAIQRINFIRNLDQEAKMPAFIEEATETILVFYKELWECCRFILL